MLHNGLYGLAVLVNGNPLGEYSHTDGRTYVPGSKGNRYSLLLHNRTSERVLFVGTVDGLSIMNGREGSLDGPGYVVAPHSSVEVLGWRLSSEEVAAFRFGGPEGAYAAKMGRPANIGVIGCAVYEENRPTLREFQLTRGEETLGGSTRGATRGLGTEFGERMEHRVSSVHFDRKPHVACILALHYNTAEDLRRKGIPVADESEAPVPFPASASAGHCQPPADWRG